MQTLVLMVLVWARIPPTLCEEPARGRLPLQLVGDSSGDHFLPTDWRACRGQPASVWCLQELSEKLCGRNWAPHIFLQCWRDLLHYVFFQYFCLHLGIVVLKKRSLTFWFRLENVGWTFPLRYTNQLWFEFKAEKIFFKPNSKCACVEFDYIQAKETALSGLWGTLLFCRSVLVFPKEMR